METLYSDFIFSKDNFKIPLYKSGKISHSKYNPFKEAENFISTIEYSDFFVVLGIAGSFHLKMLSEKFKNSKILAVEFYEKDLNLLLDNCSFINDFSNKILFSSACDFSKKLKENYLPIKFNKISLICLQSWKNENLYFYQNLIEIFNKTLNEISIDFSTQSFFGKIWQNNIIKNFYYNSKNQNYSVDINKNCYVIAAGPSLDKNIQILKNDNNSFVISTDTAYTILNKNQIIPDVVVSLDGQNISEKHFIEKLDKKTVFILDYCSNPNITKKIIKNHNKIIFSNSNHPLINYLESFLDNKSSIKLDSGSGTVTISAFNFALLCGFKNIYILGADFSFFDNKPYAKSTYLDSIYSENVSKLNNMESQYIKLMLRTKTIKNDENFLTTEILNNYKKSLIELLNQKKIPYKFENNIYKIQNFNQKTKEIRTFSTNFSNLLKFLLNNTENLISNSLDFKTSDLQNALLPYISFLKIKKYKNNEKSFQEILVEAAKNLERYVKSL